MEWKVREGEKRDGERVAEGEEMRLLPQGAPCGRWTKELSSNCGKLVRHPTTHVPLTAVSREAHVVRNVVRRWWGARKRRERRGGELR